MTANDLLPRNVRLNSIERLPKQEVIKLILHGKLRIQTRVHEYVLVRFEKPLSLLDKIPVRGGNQRLPIAFLVILVIRMKSLHTSETLPEHCFFKIVARIKNHDLMIS